MRAAAVTSLRARFPLRVLLQIAGLARSTYFHQVLVAGREDRHADLKVRIRRIVAEHGRRYGHRRVHMVLTGEGLHVAKKTVLALMRRLGLVCQVRRRRRRRYTAGAEGRIAPNGLQRRFQAEGPNQKWVTDITEFAVAGQRVYLSPVIDLFDHAVIGHQIGTRPTTSFTNASLEQAFCRAGAPAGVMVHSDQGFQYQHASWRQIIQDHDGIQSMSRRGNCHDNAVAENFFSHLKAEAFLDRYPATVAEMTQALESYIQWYNHHRIQQRLEGLTPMKYREQALEKDGALTL